MLCDVAWLMCVVFACVSLHILMRCVCDVLCDAVCGVCHCVCGTFV